MTATGLGDLSTDVWADVVGQPSAVAQLVAAARRPVHAYLLVGPRGCTKEAAARAFAALLVGGGDPAGRDVRLALEGEHPDVREVRRAGAAISAEQAREIARLAALAPVESSRKVMILDEFHLLRAEGAALLLKTIEEPPPSTVLIVVADQVPPELTTIASRCVRIEFGPIGDRDIEDRLVREGVDPVVAARAAEQAYGDLDRARLLATDADLTTRHEAFADAPRRLDGNGATVASLATTLLALIDGAAAPLEARHAAEVADLDARLAAAGERGGGRKALEDRHKRELRRHRTDELRTGLAVIAATYRDALVAGTLARPDAAEAAIRRVHDAIEALERNPNELLLLQALLLDLPSLG